MSSLPIELPDDDADVALQQAGADDDQEEPEVEGRERRERHAEMPAGDEDAAIEHGAPLADQPVGDPPAGQRGHVHHRGVETVDGARACRVESEAAGGKRRRHEQNEQRAHAVIAEALPHLGEEERRESARMAEEGAVVGRRGLAGSARGGRDRGFDHARQGIRRLCSSFACAHDACICIAVIAYLAGLAAVALSGDRADRDHDGDDFLVAGRTLPAHVLVFTLLSTWIGSGSLFAGAGLGYRVGFAALWQSAGAWAASR